MRYNFELRCRDSGRVRLGQSRPDGIGVENASDAPLIVMAAKDALMSSAIRWFIRANHRHAFMGCGEMSRCRRAHQPFANHEVIV